MKRFTPFYFLFMVLAIVGLVPDLSGASWAQAQTAQAQKPKALKASRSPRMRHNPKQGPPAVVGPPGIGRSLGCTIANQTSDTGLPCLQALTPLMPPEESNDPKQPKGYRGWYGGYTMREQPTLWVYIGYTQQSGVPLMLELYDAESATPQTAVLSRSIPKPEQASFVSISINHSLAVKRWYRWRLVAKTAKQQQVIEGVIYRASVDGTIAKQADGLDKAIALNEQGIWYDSLDQIMALKKAGNPEVQPEWESVINDIVKLPRLVEQPIATPSETVEPDDRG